MKISLLNRTGAKSVPTPLPKPIPQAPPEPVDPTEPDPEDPSEPDPEDPIKPEPSGSTRPWLTIMVIFCLMFHSGLVWGQNKKAQGKTTDSAVTRKTDSIVAAKKADSLLAAKKVDSVVAAKKLDSVTSLKKADSLAAADKADSVTTAKKTDSANTLQSSAGNAAVDYSGSWKWNAVVQIWEYYYDTRSKKFKAMNPLSIASGLTGEFFVQQVLKDKSSSDSDVIIKYLYYVTDSKDGKTSKITNNVNFLRYNYRGDSTAFTALTPQAKISRNFDTLQKYFLVKMSVFKAHAVKVPPKVRTKGALGFGILNYPFKWRIQPKIQDFTGSFNVGAAVAYTLGHDSLNKWTESFVGGVGISSITLDKQSVTTNASMLDSSNGITALTFSLGFILEYNKIQVGAFVGWDRISNLNNTTYGWKYQGNPWLSIGIGYSIFSTSSSANQSTTADTQPK
jgi:hypothetical protein